MTSMFDGLAGALNDVFGAPVTYWTTWGEERQVQAVFRLEPFQQYDQDGAETLISAPVLKVPKDLAGDLKRGVRVQDASGVRYRVENALQTEASPAADAFREFKLEREEP